ncbi:hypothetical protein ABZS86_26465, partial [Streptomyces sp. NPDC005355]
VVASRWLTTYADDDSLFPTLRAGARGYLTKDADGLDFPARQATGDPPEGAVRGGQGRNARRRP